MGDEKITKLDDRRKPTIGVCVVTMPPKEPEPCGPFTVAVSDTSGKLFEVVFPDYTGELPADANVLGTQFSQQVLCNLLTGAMRVYLGTK